MNPDLPIDKAACKLAEMAFSPHSNVHTVYEGEATVCGEPTGEPAVVAVVPTKLPAAQCVRLGLPPIPQAVVVDGEKVRVDVQEAPVLFDGAPFRIQLAFPGDGGFYAQAASDHQRCFSPLCPGGVQISPRGASWVGTLGLPWQWTADGKQRFGFLTNRHVAGLDRLLGDLICQPHGAAAPIGKLAARVDLNTLDPNEYDVALYDCEIEGRHYVAHGDVYGVGRLALGTADLTVGDAVTKSGRTTAVTSGKCIGKNAATTINYGQNRNLKFLGLDLLEIPGGPAFSEPGDSGSAVLKGNQFASLLFAGGNGQTLAIPASKVAAKIGGNPFTL
jgi:hypothetical protein